MAYTDREDLNYLGILYEIGAYQTPYINMIGFNATTGGLVPRGKISKSFLFPIAQPWSLSAASQNTQSEATAAAAGTPTTIVRSQDTNTAQIMKYDVEVSYAKQSTIGEFSGIQVLGHDQPVTDELAFQKRAQLRQMAIDIEYSFLQGAYTAPNVASTNQQTRGLKSAITTSTVAAGSVDLSKALIDQLLRTMASNGAQFTNMVLLCNGFQKQMVSDIYGFAPMDRAVGGLNIKQVETDFCMLGIVYAPQMPTDEIYIVDIPYCQPVFVPYEGQLISWSDTSITAAKKGGFFYTQIGLDYGPEEYMGSITGLTTS